MDNPSAREIAEEARAAFERSRQTPEEHFKRLVRRGFINSRGELTKLLGGEAEPEVELTPEGFPVYSERSK